MPFDFSKCPGYCEHIRRKMLLEAPPNCRQNWKEKEVRIST